MFVDTCRRPRPRAARRAREAGTGTARRVEAQGAEMTRAALIVTVAFAAYARDQQRAGAARRRGVACGLPRAQAGRSRPQGKLAGRPANHALGARFPPVRRRRASGVSRVRAHSRLRTGRADPDRARRDRLADRVRRFVRRCASRVPDAPRQAAVAAARRPRSTSVRRRACRRTSSMRPHRWWRWWACFRRGWSPHAR